MSEAIVAATFSLTLSLVSGGAIQQFAGFHGAGHLRVGVARHCGFLLAHPLIQFADGTKTANRRVAKVNYNRHAYQIGDKPNDFIR